MPAHTVNERLRDSLLRHRHFLLRVENGLAKRVAGPIRVAQEATIDELLRALSKLEVSELANLRRQRLIALERRFDEIVNIAETDSAKVLFRDLETVATRELAIQDNIFRRHVPGAITLNLTGPDLEMARRLVDQPLGGKKFADRFRRNFRGMLTEMKGSLATSAALGEGVPEASRRLRGKIKTLGMFRSTLIVRSEIQRVANRAAQELYVRNQDVVKQIQIVETLDSRTCLLCAEKDGKLLPVDSTDVPPYHAACRGITAPVTKSWEELGISRPEVSPISRASMNGQVPAATNYQDWFADQSSAFQRRVLGPTRFKAFRAGELTIPDMVKDQRILRIGELPMDLIA